MSADDISRLEYLRALSFLEQGLADQLQRRYSCCKPGHVGLKKAAIHQSRAAKIRREMMVLKKKIAAPG